MTTGTLGFAPRWSADGFRCLFTAGTAWGSFHQRRDDDGLELCIEVEGGSFALRRLVVDGAAILDLDEPCELAPGRRLHVIAGRPASTS
ncbi:MAG: hypothetical protein R3C32_03495 [Chloroflexota bacterium]